MGDGNASAQGRKTIVTSLFTDIYAVSKLPVDCDFGTKIITCQAHSGAPASKHKITIESWRGPIG